MKKLLITLMIAIISLTTNAQGRPFTPYPPTQKYDTIMTWASVPIQYAVNEAQVIFEGKVLSDSIFISNHHTYTYHLVQVLKLFKGSFNSDTVAIATGGGGTDIIDGLANDVQYGGKGDIAFFLVRSYENIYHAVHGEGDGYITLCDKKDVEKYIYEPMEKAIGHPYKEIHPSDCPNTKPGMKK